ncbi:hypothetical protein ACEN88_32655 [Massilia sp. CT11-108]|uniref:hypothetical protein n=1 Tax=Massilia sp. CT11-108 TaxID=3393900 RepID=UPI0039A715AF
MADLQKAMHRIIGVYFHMEIDLPRQAGYDAICINAGTMLSLKQQVVDLARKNVTLWQIVLSGM